MKVLDVGHVYELRHLDGRGRSILCFVNREPGREHEGTLNQEVLRALIDRVQYLDSQTPWDGNAKIVQHLRMALALHEARAIERKAQLLKIEPECIACSDDGHYLLTPNVCNLAWVQTADAARLPAFDTPVWLYEDGAAYIGCRSDESDGWRWAKCYCMPYLDKTGAWILAEANGDDDYQPTLWQPLPEPPNTGPARA